MEYGMELIPNQPLLLDNGEDEQRASEQGLQSSAIPYITILEHMPESVLALDSQWRIIYLNHQAEWFLQKTKAEVLGCTVWEAIPKAQDSSFIKCCQQARTTGKVVSFEQLSLLLNMWFQVYVYPSEEGICIYFQDITQRKQAEERLQQSEKHFRSLIEHNADGIALADAKGIITYISPSTTHVTGYLPEEFVGHGLFQRMVYPEDGEATKRLLARVFEEPGKSHELEYRTRHKNGTFLWLEAIGINLLHEPGVEAIVWNFRDITQRKQLTEAVAKAKEQLEAILHNVADGILVADPNGSVVYVNDVAARSFGFPSAATMLATPQASLDEIFSQFEIWDVRGRPLPLEEQPIVQALQGKKAHALIQYQDTVTDQRHWILVRAQPIVDTQGQVQFVVSVSTDSTEQKEFEEQRDEFIMSVSHELRTPLTAVIGFLELLRDYQERLDSPTQAQFLSRALENCLELKHLVNSVLDALLASDATHPVQLEQLVVCETVREVLAQFDPDAKQAHELTVMISEDITVWADKQYLQQVLRNLLSNALKYAPQQTPILLSATHREESSQATTSVPQICICVQDAGPGIPLAEQSWLFQKFKRLKRDLTSTVRGTGLGLYISKQLVEMMEGHIWVESSGRAGEGSRFCITLPEAEAPSFHA